MNLKVIRNKLEYFYETLEASVHLFYSLILIVISIGLLYAFYAEPLTSLYHDLTWLDSKGKITNISYAYRGYTELFETIHQVNKISDLKVITGKNTYFIFIDYQYGLKDQTINANYQFNNMGQDDKNVFFKRIELIKVGDSFELKIDPKNYALSLPKRETKFNGKEDNLVTPALWISLFITIAVLYIRDSRKKLKPRLNRDD